MTGSRTAAPVEIAWRDDGATVGGLWLRPEAARGALALAHGAGAGIRHGFMEALAAALAERSVATLRYRFAYMEAGRRRPDPPATAVAVVRAAVAAAVPLADGLPLFAGGKSFGGRMTAAAAAETDLPVRGLVFFGFPLHPAGKPSLERAEHLAHAERPMLFLQGTRDRLADLHLLRPVVGGLGGRARLHVVDGADHGFHVLARSGRTDEDVIRELAEVAAEWIDTLA